MSAPRYCSNASRSPAPATSRPAGAVEAEDDLVAVVDGAELGRRGEDVEQVVDLVDGQRRDLGPLDRRLDPGVDVGAHLAPGQAEE